MTERTTELPEGSAAGRATAGEVLSAYLHAQAGDFLRSLRLHRESGSDVEEAAEAARLLRRAARRISGALYVYRPLTDTAWSDQLRAELAWLSGTLALEHAYAERLARLRCALHRLSGVGGQPDRSPLGDTATGEGTASTDPAGGAASPARASRGGVTVGIDGAPAGPSGSSGSAAGSATPRSARAARRSVSLATRAPGAGAADPAGGRGARPGPADAISGAEAAPGEDAAPTGRRRGERADRTDRGDSDQGDRGDRGDRGDSDRGDRGDREDKHGTSGPSGGAAHQRAGVEEEPRGGALTVGAARAGALLERQLTLARTRAHTAALQALGSSRFHAVADTVALLASEVPLDEPTAERPAEQVLPPLAELANRRLIEAVEALPLGRAGLPYNAEALVHGLAATPAADAPPASEHQDAPWHQVRHLVRARRYALEVLDQGQQPSGPAPSGAGPNGPGPGEAEPPLSVRLLAAAQALERHRDAAAAAAAAASAARTPRIAPATAYALGVLHADQRHEVEAARFAFGRIWRRVAARAS
ncbi:CHAD domain-containing protein [Streptomyces sp. NPDC005355]|uniref:CHAD domain-containing protein n=1 Tax=Streptomyces sp. NPDC005355 TaxID=3157038 RepID=UPI0033AEA7D4